MIPPQLSHPASSVRHGATNDKLFAGHCPGWSASNSSTMCRNSNLVQQGAWQIGMKVATQPLLSQSPQSREALASAWDGWWTHIPVGKLVFLILRG